MTKPGSTFYWFTFANLLIQAVNAALAFLMALLFIAWSQDHLELALLAIVAYLVTTVASIMAILKIRKSDWNASAIYAGVVFVGALAVAIINMIRLQATLPLVNLIQICMAGFCKFEGSPYQQPWFTLYVIAGLSFYAMPFLVFGLYRKSKRV